VALEKLKTTKKEKLTPEQGERWGGGACETLRDAKTLIYAQYLAPPTSGCIRCHAAGQA
jgi:hypothetical protein